MLTVLYSIRGIHNYNHKYQNAHHEFALLGPGASLFLPSPICDLV
jgi:hypothetical protein